MTHINLALGHVQYGTEHASPDCRQRRIVWTKWLREEGHGEKEKDGATGAPRRGPRFDSRTFLTSAGAGRSSAILQPKETSDGRPNTGLSRFLKT